jgi:hypothetical protein
MGYRICSTVLLWQREPIWAIEYAVLFSCGAGWTICAIGYAVLFSCGEGWTICAIGYAVGCSTNNMSDPT